MVERVENGNMIFGYGISKTQASETLMQEKKSWERVFSSLKSCYDVLLNVGWSCYWFNLWIMVGLKIDQNYFLNRKMMQTCNYHLKRRVKS